MALRIAATATQPAQSTSAAFELQGDAEQGELRLNSPLGTSVARARWGAGTAVLATSDGERRFASLAELSREALGEELPLAALPSWLAGRPWPGTVHEALPGPGSGSGFTQLGWTVGLAASAEGRIEIVRDTPPQVRLLVRLDEAKGLASP
jgi:outer membrane lipoprotein LolB